MAKDLTNSKVDRQNILNNSYAMTKISKACKIDGVVFEEKIAFTKDQVSKFYENLLLGKNNNLHSKDLILEEIFSK